MQESRHISAFYLFEPNKGTLDRQKIPFEEIYKDKDVEIYKVNFEWNIYQNILIFDADSYINQFIQHGIF